MKRSEIFILFSCDVWKTYSSFRFFMATTDPELCVKTIYEELENNHMEYGGYETQEASDLLMRDYSSYGISHLDGKLIYGSIIITEDGVTG